MLGRWVNAEPATDFAALEDLGSLRIFAALEATAFDVFSFLDIVVSFLNELEKKQVGRSLPTQIIRIYHPYL